MEYSTFVTLTVILATLGPPNEALADDCQVPAFAANFTQDRFLSYLTASCRYDKYVLPEASMPLNVTARVDVKYLEVMQTQFTAYLTVQFQYEDKKLNFENLTTTRSIIFGDTEIKDQIWTPRIELKDTSDTTIVRSDQEETLVSIHKRGVVTYTYKLVARFYCWMDLKKFPFDSQKCTLAFSDWSYDNTQLKLSWNNVSRPVFATGLHFTEYIIDEIVYSGGNNDGPYKISAQSSTLGDFSELVISFTFHRDSGYYLLVFYLPSYLLVCAAWVTFWLHADAGPPRAALGSSTVVAFITLHLGLSKDIPKVSYIKASDIWFLGVSCFIFISLAEFAFVNVIWRRKKMVELKKPKPKYIFKSALMPSKSREDLRKYEIQMGGMRPGDGDSVASFPRSPSQETLTMDQTIISIPENEVLEFSWTKMTPQEVAVYIDRKARVVFPVLFLLFNILYWAFVLY